MYDEGWEMLLTIGVMWVITSFISAVILLLNVLLGTLMGALAGWLLSLTPPGSWIVEGLRFFGVPAASSKLYEIGAAAGFTTGFLKLSVSPPRIRSKN